jgi:uracil phosphoribosyltransferase
MERASHERLLVVEHPAVADRLARLRDRDTPTPVFRKLLEELGAFLAYEATRNLPLRDEHVITPLTPMVAHRVAVRPVVAPILRAGLGLLPGFLEVIDDAVVAHLGFYRDPQTLQPVPYYANVPHDLSQRHVYVLDPMLATGGSAVHALEKLKRAGAKQLELVCLVAAPQGVEAVQSAHPDVRIWTAAIDRELDENAYIRPGLGDAGDRVFGTA